MGNSHSQNRQMSSNQWTHSYPRPRHAQPQIKVLPERIPPLRLRITDNGSILQNGGTLSGRKQPHEEEGKLHRPRSSSAHRPPKLEDISLEKARYGSEPDLRLHLKESRGHFGDIAARQRISRSRKKYKAPAAPQNGISSGMESSSPDLNCWEMNGKDCHAEPGRKARLFKTRAETSKKKAMALRKMESSEVEVIEPPDLFNKTKPKVDEGLLVQSTNDEKERSERRANKNLKRSASHEIISSKKSLASPEFQAELREVAQRLRPRSEVHRRNSEKATNPKAQIDPYAKENILPGNRADFPKDKKVISNRKVSSSRQADAASGKCCRMENFGNDKGEKLQNLFGEPTSVKQERDVPSKKFYFGMEENINLGGEVANNFVGTNNVDKTNAEHRVTAVERNKNVMNLYKSVAQGIQDWEDSVDKFAASFHKSQITVTNGNTTSCSSSFVSDPDDDALGGIALQLRPTLPKKQLEIPRFSPTAAWRLLSSIDTFHSLSPSPGESDDGLLCSEDRVRPPGPQQAMRTGHDKSGDSGISGDASPGGCVESSSEIAIPTTQTLADHNSKNILMAWTPQQDLEESSSDDLESPLNSMKNVVSNVPGAKFSPRGQLFFSRDQSFSKSVPREERICLTPEMENSKERADSMLRLNSLRKLKAALGTAKRSEVLNGSVLSQNGNWMLSRSVSGSHGNGNAAIGRSMSNPPSPEQDEDHSHQTSLNYSSYSCLTGGSRIMYLPEYHSRASPDISGKAFPNKLFASFLSKSCENITQTELMQPKKSRTPSPVVNSFLDKVELSSDYSRNNQKKRKFAFQSTVRLIENRRIADRLSKEAELKENQRLSEVEAMRKVEEEFQKKRAREKASIRHQLRLFNLEEKNFSSLPSSALEESQPISDEPPLSFPSSSTQTQSFRNKNPAAEMEMNKFAPVTQVLSEYREPTRDYKDYRHPRYSEFQDLPQENKKSVVEHPKIVCDMPKNTAVYLSAPMNSSTTNHYKEESRVSLMTPRSSRSDNYRKDFAHGTLIAGGRSLTSSDSETSHPHSRTGSRQDVTPSRLKASYRSRSVSPESAKSGSFPNSDHHHHRQPRSRSTSPNKKLLFRKSSSASLKEIPKKQETTNRDANGGEKFSNNFFNSLERRSSNLNNFNHSFNSKVMTVNRRQDKQNSVAPGSKSSMIHVGLPSLKPFDKSEKSFRPINFNPVVNKLAQTVN